jgi:hypothetical protein
LSDLSLKDFFSYICINCQSFSDKLKDFLYYNINAFNISIDYKNELFITCQIKDFLQAFQQFKIITFSDI